MPPVNYMAALRLEKLLAIRRVEFEERMLNLESTSADQANEQGLFMDLYSICASTRALEAELRSML